VRDIGSTEVAGFGVCGDLDRPMLITDFLMVKQSASAAFVSMDDVGVADFTEDMVDNGLQPFQFLRIWIHTHPGSSPIPSGQDEDTFNEVFGDCHWAIMFILAKEGKTYCRLRWQLEHGPRGTMEIDHSVDFQYPFAASDHDAWDDEYEDTVTVNKTYWGRGYSGKYRYGDDEGYVVNGVWRPSPGKTTVSPNTGPTGSSYLGNKADPTKVGKPAEKTDTTQYDLSDYVVDDSDVEAANEEMLTTMGFLEDNTDGSIADQTEAAGGFVDEWTHDDLISAIEKETDEDKLEVLLMAYQEQYGDACT